MKHVLAFLLAAVIPISLFGCAPSSDISSESAEISVSDASGEGSVGYACSLSSPDGTATLYYDDVQSDIFIIYGDYRYSYYPVSYQPADSSVADAIWSADGKAVCIAFDGETADTAVWWAYEGSPVVLCTSESALFPLAETKMGTLIAGESEIIPWIHCDNESPRFDESDVLAYLYNGDEDSCPVGISYTYNAPDYTDTIVIIPKNDGSIVELCAINGNGEYDVLIRYEDIGPDSAISFGCNIPESGDMLYAVTVKCGGNTKTESLCFDGRCESNVSIIKE
ncbi:MAG: hypothetical protein PUC63_03380 [Clostridiales bacterium]|nr:hypothetical protein [Clostridiales bacterium]